MSKQVEQSKSLNNTAHLIAIETLNDTKFMTTTIGYVLGKLQDIFIAGAKWGAEHQVIDDNKMIESSKDLEEAAEKYADKHGFRVPYDGSNNYYDDVDVKASKEGFLAGAEWMKKQMEDEQ